MFKITSFHSIEDLGDFIGVNLNVEINDERKDWNNLNSCKIEVKYNPKTKKPIDCTLWNTGCNGEMESIDTFNFTKDEEKMILEYINNNKLLKEIS